MQTITAEQLQTLKNSSNNPPVINVLPESSYADSHIPDSVSIPLESPDFLNQVDGQVGDRSNKVVVYCANTSCDLSPKAAKILEDAGYSDVVDFEGGTEGWKYAGFTVETGQPATRR